MKRPSLFTRKSEKAGGLIEAYYKGAKVQAYEDRRRGNPKWAFEDEGLKEALKSIPAPEKTIVADVPLGTNRFHTTLDSDAAITAVYGLDYSVDMLKASMDRATPKFYYARRDVINERPTIDYDTAITFRFYNLFDLPTAGKALENIGAACRHHMILTVRLTEDPAEAGTIFKNKIHIHESAAFLEMLDATGFKIKMQKERPDEKPGVYHIILATRKQG